MPPTWATASSEFLLHPKACAALAASRSGNIADPVSMLQGVGVGTGAAGEHAADATLGLLLVVYIRPQPGMLVTCRHLQLPRRICQQPDWSPTHRASTNRYIALNGSLG